MRWFRRCAPAAAALVVLPWLFQPHPRLGGTPAPVDGAAMHSDFHASVQAHEEVSEVQQTHESSDVGSGSERQQSGVATEAYDQAECQTATEWRNLTAQEEGAYYPRCSGKRTPAALKFLLKICRGGSRLPFALAARGCDGPLDGVAFWRAVGPGRTLFLAGDSIFHTQFWALACQLNRWRGRVSSNSSVEAAVKWRWVSLCFSSVGGLGVDGARVCYRDWMPWKLGLKATATPDRAWWLLQEAGGLAPPEEGDVVVLNAGHHLHTPEEMQRAATVIKEVLKRLCGVRVLWEETSPTAYPIPSGDEYEFQTGFPEDRSRWPCGENSSNTSLSNWKNNALAPL
eukprot:Hpha_TRINITY_DN5297_c0_g1::TRINITY_DN5297_c0_g1_i1::g.116556::m.116556